MRHRFLLPYPIKIPPSSLPSRIFPSLSFWIRSTFSRSSNINNRHATLLSIDPKQSRDEDEYIAENEIKPRRLLNLPNAARDITGMKPVDSDVFVFIVLEESVLEFCQPDLEIELVVLVVLDAAWTSVCGLLAVAVEVGDVVVAEEVEAGCCAEYSWCFGF